jgi:hypothetical protein
MHAILQVYFAVSICPYLLYFQRTMKIRPLMLALADSRIVAARITTKTTQILLIFLYVPLATTI